LAAWKTCSSGHGIGRGKAAYNKAAQGKGSSRCRKPGATARAWAVGAAAALAWPHLI